MTQQKVVLERGHLNVYVLNTVGAVNFAAARTARAVCEAVEAGRVPALPTVSRRPSGGRA